VQYRLCLQEKDSPERFYHASFGVDPVAVSRTLLNWRDQLYCAGWNGAFPETASRRLKDLAHVEKEASVRVAPGRGQRLQSVIRALKDQKTGIEKIELIDPPFDYPYLWQKVFSRFKTEALFIDDRPPPERPATDLARLQRALESFPRKEGRAPGEIEWQNDGSLVVLAAQSRAVSARFVSEYLKDAAPGRQVRIICGDSGHLLDQALETVDVARCGFDSVSCFRPLSQALILALELVWKPADPFHLQAYLTHPVSPIPFWVRHRLAKALLEAPGIGGRAWNAALNWIRNKNSEKESGDVNIQKILSDVDFWIHCPRYDPAEGAPIDGIRERCDKITAWLIRMRYAEKNPHIQALYDPAISRAKDLSESLETLRAAGMTRIDRVNLNQLLNAVMETWSTGLKKSPELGHPMAVEAPAVLVAPVDEVIWWDFSMPVLPATEPWTVSECRDLEEHHVRLHPLQDRLAHIARTWRRPVMAAEKRLVLVLHHGDEEHHPLWHEIRILLPHLAQKEIEPALQSDQTIPAFPVRAAPLELKPLPPVRRWWCLPDAGLLKTRKSESYSRGAQIQGKTGTRKPFGIAFRKSFVREPVSPAHRRIVCNPQGLDRVDRRKNPSMA
ncbi:MAG: hypothetical protein JRJ54_16100, partial [Deltaproteobacteria bacterium]|nr:hypothetical protein [Deltaproteobacteria bacterium]